MYNGFYANKSEHPGGSSSKSVELYLARAQRRRMQAMLRKTKSCIEALRARVLLLLRDQRSTGEPTKATPQVEQCRLGYLDNVQKAYGWDRANWTLGRPRTGMRSPGRGRPRRQPQRRSSW